MKQELRQLIIELKRLLKHHRGVRSTNEEQITEGLLRKGITWFTKEVEHDDSSDMSTSDNESQSLLKRSSLRSYRHVGGGESLTGGDMQN
ncbi:hypothetical protein DY000_02023506 [Brassica cretica]|uniref:Uncharacterized protein n=1 Tax=Brassica cretica TaxID=69181 RepID=A0ABQ7ECK8_BRACR|nr:hypothetical protein DY000_02023506 [Brassica cretica]